MKYLAALRSILILAAILILNPIATTEQATAATLMTYDSHARSHLSANSQSPSCVSLCASATLKDEKETRLVSDEQDDEPVPPKALPYYAHLGSNFIPRKLAGSYAQNYLVFRPPDLVKLYSSYRF